MRIIRTTRGLVCQQIGRVQNGELGELGIDGAYHDDGRFHPLPASVLPADAASGAGTNSSCQLAGETFSGSLAGIDRNAASTRESPAAPASRQREISYGLLGAHAQTIAYTTPSGKRTVSVEAGSGAYLIVQAVTAPLPAETVGGSIGSDQLHGRRPNPVGALTAISYRFGSTICSDSPASPGPDPCPRPASVPAAHPPVLPSLHRPIHVSLDVHDGRRHC